MSNEFFASLIENLAWPITVLLVVFFLIREIKNGILEKITNSIGVIQFGEFRVEMKEKVNNVEDLIKSSDIPIPNIAESYEKDEDSPYDIIIFSWRNLAKSVTDFAMKHGGQGDQKKVRSNIDLLEREKIITENIQKSIRELQMIRNRVRRKGANSIDIDFAVKYSRSAEALVNYFNTLNSA